MLLNREDLINIRNTYKESFHNEKVKILVCGGTGCIAGGSLEIYDEFVRLMKEKDIRCEVKLEKESHEKSV